MISIMAEPKWVKLSGIIYGMRETDLAKESFSKKVKMKKVKIFG